MRLFNRRTRGSSEVGWAVGVNAGSPVVFDVLLGAISRFVLVHIKVGFV